MATKYQALVKEQAKFCAGKSTKTKVNAKKKAYIDDATKKGRKKSEATASANRVTKRCTKKAKVSGTRKRRKK